MLNELIFRGFWQVFWEVSNIFQVYWALKRKSRRLEEVQLVKKNKNKLIQLLTRWERILHSFLKQIFLLWKPKRWWSKLAAWRTCWSGRTWSGWARTWTSPATGPHWQHSVLKFSIGLRRLKWQKTCHYKKRYAGPRWVCALALPPSTFLPWSPSGCSQWLSFVATPI